jgi:FG-GAP repeat
MRRVATVLVIVLVGAGVPAAWTLARAPAAVQAAPAGGLRADFDNDGADDLAVGVPGEDTGGRVDAGAVNVLYGEAPTPGVRGQLFTQVGGTVESGDQFGVGLASADFDNDGFADLAVSAPTENVAGAAEAGAVSVLYGSAGGLGTARGQLFTQVGNPAESGDQFGFVLAAGDFDNDGFADLAAGVPFENVGATADAGAVSVLRGSAGGLTTAGGQFFTQVGGAVEGGDSFGIALAAGDFTHDGFTDLASGASLENIATISDAGTVSVLRGSAGGLTTDGAQLFGSPGDAAEAGDQFGFALAAGDFNNDLFADLAVGAAEDVGAAVDAGAVNVLYGSSDGLTTAIGQQHFFTAVGGGAIETGDLFGWALAAGDFDNDGFDDLGVGIPGEDTGGRVDAGALGVLDGTADGLLPDTGQLFLQAAGTVEGDDVFGFAVASGDFDADGFADLAVAAPFEDVGTRIDAGSVSALDGVTGGLSVAGAQLFTQDSFGVPGGAETGDFFGGAVVAGDSGPAAAGAAATARTSGVVR